MQRAVTLKHNRDTFLRQKIHAVSFDKYVEQWTSDIFTQFWVETLFPYNFNATFGATYILKQGYLFCRLIESCRLSKEVLCL